MKLIRKPHVKDGWYEITPDAAQQLLANMGINRPLTEVHARNLADDVRAKEFQANGQALVFDDAGRLLDGQHRCRAVVLANRSLITYCVFGVAKSNFASFDRGKSRTGADVSAIVGMRHYSLAAGLVRLWIGYNSAEAGSRFSMGARTVISNWEIVDALKKDREAIQKACDDVRRCRLPKGWVPPSHLAFVYYMAMRDNATKAALWLEQVTSGEGLTANSPTLVLRNRLSEIALSKNKPPVMERLALLVKSWLAFRDARRVTLIKWDRRESFPRFEATA